jgi:predicted TIM-barrel fold metal-dependent hydrolase
MERRVTWLQGVLGLGPGRILDTLVFRAPRSRKAPDPARPAGGTPATAGQPAEETEDARLADVIVDMDRAHVDASLVVLHEETDDFPRLTAQHPGRLFGLAHYDSLSPHRGLERVRRLCDDHPGLILGVTTTMPRLGQDPRLGEFVPLYEFCIERDLPVQFDAAEDATGERAAQPVAFGVLAKTYPRLNVVCRDTGSWRGEALALLHRFPNLFLQVDGLSLHPLLHAAGSHKLVFGSDWRGREARYFERVEAVRRLPWRHRQNVGWRTAVRVYGPRLLHPPARFDPQPSPR